MNIRLTRWHQLAAVAIVGLLVIGVGSQLASPKVFRVGVLNADAPIEPVFDGFKAEMERLGYADGQTIEYLYDGPVGNEPGKLEAAAESLMDAQVDLILAITTPAATVAKQTVDGTSTPVIFWVMADPVREAYVSTMQRPGGNMSGVTIGVEGIASEGRRLEWLKQIAPDIEQVFIPYDPNHRGVVEQALPTIQEAADSLGIELVLQRVNNPEEARASAENIPDDVDAVYIIYLDRMVMMAARQAFIELTLQRHLPLSMFNQGDVEHGALMSFGTKYFAIGEQAARMADQILKGAQVAEMPVEIPEFYLSVNLQTAGAIGLEVPDSIIRQADLVVR
jgi:putative ABC transport system substrate-binding protein